MQSWTSNSKLKARNSLLQSRTVSFSATFRRFEVRLTFFGVVNLVHKDQLEILATLRESVNEDKAGLESEVQRLQDQIRELSDKNKMQLEQINGLLFEKVTLQSEGIDQRDRMLQRERDIGYGILVCAKSIAFSSIL